MPRWFCLALSMALPLGGCSVVRIDAADGTTRIERRLGVVEVHLDPAAEAMVGELSAFGYASSPLGTSLGYSSQLIAALPAACRVVFWVEDPRQLERIEALLADVDDVCPVVTAKETDP